MDDRPLIFISYASPDLDRVLPYFQAFQGGGFDVWLDRDRLKPGQKWDYEIKRALARATIVIAFVSNNSVDRRGYVQRELKIALDQAFDKLNEDIYIIPMLLDDDAIVPRQLQDVQVVRASDPNCKEQVADAIQHQIAKLGEQIAETQDHSNVRWTYTKYKDAWDGLPGYETDIQFVHLYSDEYTRVAEISDIIRGALIAGAMRARLVKFEQDVEMYNFGQLSHFRMNTWDAAATTPSIKGKLISINYHIGWYGAGAAHPNYYFQTFCFLLEPLVRIETLSECFIDADAALTLLEQIAREQLNAEISADSDADTDVEFLKELIHGGTESWSSFGNFSFKAEAIELYFSPYQVAPYATGSRSVNVPYDSIKALLKPHFRSALELY
ncbi:MAG: hypothetical protein JWN34_1794 [Bryobacterales bacterium]|nr:hypothetical protein [Bryobacterales bacterium]